MFWWVKVGIILSFYVNVVSRYDSEFPNAVERNENKSQNERPMHIFEFIESIDGQKPDNYNVLYQLKDFINKSKYIFGYLIIDIVEIIFLVQSLPSLKKLKLFLVINWDVSSTHSSD